MFEGEKHSQSCCSIGHRPEKLQHNEAYYRIALADAICRAIDRGYHTFISSMARGIDIWAVEDALKWDGQSRRSPNMFATLNAASKSMRSTFLTGNGTIKSRILSLENIVCSPSFQHIENSKLFLPSFFMMLLDRITYRPFQARRIL